MATQISAAAPRRVPHALALAALLTLGLAPAASQAGVRLETETRRADAAPDAAPERSVVRVEGERLRIDDGAGRGSLLYEAARGKAWLLDHRERRYVSVDRSQARALAQQARGLRDEARRRLEERLTAEQMEAAEALLGDAEVAEEVEVRETGRRDRVAGVACRELEVRRAGERIARLCAAEPEAAGLPEAAFALLRDVAGFVEESVGGIAPGGIREGGLELLGAARELDVLPLRVHAYEDGTLRSVSEVSRIAEEPVADEVFALPEGYRAMFAVKVRGEGASQGADTPNP